MGRVPAAAAAYAVLRLVVVLLALRPCAMAGTAAAASLVIGFDKKFPPYHYVDADGQSLGFGVELMTIIGRLKGLHFEVRAGPWHQIWDELEAGRIDVATAVRTAEREHRFDFGDPVIFAQHTVFVRDDSPIRSPADLRGRAVVVREKSIWDEKLHELAGLYALRVTHVETTDAALRAVAAGEQDAAFMPDLHGLYLLRTLGLPRMRSLGLPVAILPYRLVVPKGRRELLEQLNDGLALARISGEFDALYDKWFGVLKAPSPLFRVLKVGSLGLFVLFVGSAAWSWSLRRAVARRTRELATSEQARLSAVEDQNRLEQRMLKMQKMEALGRLAGAVAHDFNNVLTAIVGSVSLARDAAPGEETDELLQQIEQAGTAATNLTRQLLAFSRSQVVEPELLTWNEVLQALELMLRGSITSGITLEIQLEPAPWSICIDRGQATQIVLNLLVNARDAVSRGGRIWIVTGNQTAGGADFACLTVRDDGVGMDAATKERIFEPFFTTKTVGRGTGLGLPTAYGIVTQHGGTIEVESELDEGATFRVLLPRANVPQRAEPPAPSAPRESPPRLPLRPPDPPKESVSDPPPAILFDAPTGIPAPGTILLVDDDADVRRVGLQMLESLGYRAVSVADGAAALRILRETPDVIAVVTDVVMPGMDGFELARAVARERPSVRILVTSGYTGSRGALSVDRNRLVRFVPKPFDRNTLRDSLKTVLATVRPQMGE